MKNVYSHKPIRSIIFLHANDKPKYFSFLIVLSLSKLLRLKSKDSLFHARGGFSECNIPKPCQTPRLKTEAEVQMCSVKRCS